MITLENNELHFSFPEISDELRRLADAEIARLTAQFLAEDRDAAFKYLLKHDYRGYDIDACYVLEAKNALLALTPEKIAAAIRQHLEKLPWFDYYRDDLAAVNGAPELAGLKTVAQLHQGIETIPLPNNGTVAPEMLIQYGNRRRPNEVLEWRDDEASRG